MDTQTHTEEKGRQPTAQGKTSAVDVPVGEGVLDVVAGGVDEDATLVPGPRLDADVLVDRAQVLQLTVADRDH